MRECDYCQHVEMCRWRKDVEEQGCEFFDDGNKWIPVSERLPEERINPITENYYEYQCTYQGYRVKDVRHYKFGNGHWWHGPEIMDKYVTAWMPLPEPYEPQERSE